MRRCPLKNGKYDLVLVLPYHNPQQVPNFSKVQDLENGGKGSRQISAATSEESVAQAEEFRSLDFEADSFYGAMDPLGGKWNHGGGLWKNLGACSHAFSCSI